VGAEVSHGGHGQIKVVLGGHAQAFHDSRHSLSREEEVAMRRFLEQAGVDPARDYPL
jgi:hypothetical protein